jgi:hypothetical protein
MMQRKLLTAAAILGGLAVTPARAALIYDTGALQFASTAQSIWGPGEAFRREQSTFLGTQWTNKTATIGGIAGSEDAVVFPGTDPLFAPIFEPRVFIPTPTWTNPFAGYFTGCGCFKSVQIAPGLPEITADTRTGVQIDVRSSGKVGIEFGYSIDSGSIDTTANFGATALLPDSVAAAEFFSIGTSSIFADGTIATQSPKAEAYMSAIMQLSGSVNAQACALTFGCATGTTALPTVNMDQRILSIDPGSLKILDGVLPGDEPNEFEPLAEIAIANRTLKLEAGLAPFPGFKLSEDTGLPIITTVPDTPAAVLIDIAEIELNVPDIATTGSGGGEKVTSTGRDDLLSALLDIDGAATIFGGLPPAGLNFDLIDTPAFKVEVDFDLIDVDAGPVLGLRQDFELLPTLMVNLAFSNPIQIAGIAGLQSSWTGLWGALPQFAISQTTTFTPTFWLDAQLRNNTGLDLGLLGKLDVLKLGATAKVGEIDLLEFNDISLNQLLGLGNTLFETDKLFFSVFENTFGLGGFNLITGTSFTLGIGQSPVIGDGSSPGPGPTPVPEPGSLWLILSGLSGALLLRSNRSRRGSAVSRA